MKWMRTAADSSPVPSQVRQGYISAFWAASASSNETRRRQWPVRWQMTKASRTSALARRRLLRSVRRFQLMPQEYTGSRAGATALPVMMSQILMQRRRPGFLEQRLEHHVLAMALGEARTIFLAQRGYFRVAVLLFDFSALVAVPSVEAAMCLCHDVLLSQ